MTYAIIQPPFSLEFDSMNGQALEEYRRWFHRMPSERIAVLASAVASTAGYERWKPDLSPDSLNLLGDWFRGAVETRMRTEEEVLEIEQRLTFPMEIPNEELTNRSLSLAMDVGFYLGQVVFKNVPGVQWEQPMKKGDADFGQPVIGAAGPLSLNPIRIAVNLAYSFASGKQPASRLRALYDFWSKNLSKT